MGFHGIGPDTERVGPAPQGVGAVLIWYAANARDLPWRAADRSSWGVLVSEIMLQQTQVSRVEPRWREWMRRWPTPAGLAAEPAAEAIRAWQGLGYPRRALRLHAAARQIIEHHGGEVPSDYEALRALPGIGEYTACAVLAFAHGRAVPVLDTNVRRVLARWQFATARQASSGITARERSLARELLPADGLAATWSVAVMELGALVCTARAPDCQRCPLAGDCAWLAAGRPPDPEQAVVGARFEGSDRQARGFLLRAAAGGRDLIGADDLVAAWRAHRGAAPGSVEQAQRALASLLADGLLVEHGDALGLPRH